MCWMWSYTQYEYTQCEYSAFIHKVLDWESFLSRKVHCTSSLINRCMIWQHQPFIYLFTPSSHIIVLDYEILYSVLNLFEIEIYRIMNNVIIFKIIMFVTSTLQYSALRAFKRYCMIVVLLKSFLGRVLGSAQFKPNCHEWIGVFSVMRPEEL